MPWKYLFRSFLYSFHYRVAQFSSVLEESDAGSIPRYARNKAEETKRAMELVDKIIMNERMKQGHYYNHSRRKHSFKAGDKETFHCLVLNKMLLVA